MASETGEDLTCVSIILAKWCVRKVTRLQLEDKTCVEFTTGIKFFFSDGGTVYELILIIANKILESEVKQLTGRVH